MASANEASGSEMTFEEMDLSHIKVEADTSDTDGCANLSDVSAEQSEKKWPISGKLEGVSISYSADEVIFKCSKVSMCCAHAMKRVLQGNPPMHIKQHARLDGLGYPITTVVTRTIDLVKSYYHMAKHHYSVHCARLQCDPVFVVCPSRGCGHVYSGRRTHFLDLVNHILSKHKSERSLLILDIMKTYHETLSYMRAMLQADTAYIARNFPV